MMSVAANIHATLIVLGGKGVLIMGPSGSGKSTLACHLVRHCEDRGTFAGIVADDRVMISLVNGRLIGSSPKNIAGLIETYGAGITSHRHVERCVIDLLFTLVDADAVARMPTSVYVTIAGTAHEAYQLPKGHFIGAQNIINARLAGNIIADA